MVNRKIQFNQTSISSRYYHRKRSGDRNWL